MAHILVRGACVEVPQSLLRKPAGKVTLILFSISDTSSALAKFLDRISCTAVSDGFELYNALIHHCDPLQKIKIGFVGTGTITVAVVTGLCSAEDAADLQITVSPRNQENAAGLCSRFPLQVTIARDNQEVLDNSDIVCIAIIPAQAQDVLSGLR